MVSKRDIEKTLDNQTLDGTLAKGTVVDISAVVTTVVDARISAAMDEFPHNASHSPHALPVSLLTPSHAPPLGLAHPPTLVQSSAIGVIALPLAGLAANPRGCPKVENPIHSTFEVGESPPKSRAHEQSTSPSIAHHQLDLLRQQIAEIKTMLEPPSSCHLTSLGRYLVLHRETLRKDTEKNNCIPSIKMPLIYTLQKQAHKWKQRTMDVTSFFNRSQPKFDIVRKHILIQRPIPSLMEVCSKRFALSDHTSAMTSLTNPTIDFVAFNARSPSHAIRSTVENQSLSVNTVENSCIPRSNVGNYIVVPQEVRNALTTTNKHGDLSSGRMIGIVWHSKELHMFNDDASFSSISRTSLLSSYFTTSEKDCIIESPFPHNHINQPNVSLLSIVMFEDRPRVAERKNRHLLEVARSLMLSTSLPSYLWGDVLTAAHLINQMSSHILHLQTPLECLKEFYPSTHPISNACMFVGYSLHRGYRCFHPSPLKYFISMDVTFLEDHPFFPVSLLHGESESEEPNYVVPSESTYPTLSTLVQDSEPLRDQDMTDSIDSHINNRMSENDKSEMNSTKAHSDDKVGENDGSANNGSETAIPEDMVKKGSVDEVITDRYVKIDENEVVAESTENKTKQDHSGNINKYDPSLDLPIALRKAFTSNLDSTTIPKNIHLALECPEWKIAIMEKMKALKKNKIKELCTLTKGHKTVGCKWVSALKYKADGTLDRHKVRLVAKGFTQTYGIDYSETFSPVAKLNIVRVLLSIAGLQSRTLHHILFTKVSKTRKIAVLIVHVDDIVLSKDDTIEIIQLKNKMGDELEIKNLGNLEYFLGMGVARSREGIYMSLKKYTLYLLNETSMMGCRPVNTPIEFNVKLES
ncbi:reverse transcriptase [Cucumis melo var. makuwa]|uniref:Reverse transcriptase n=1 Tax=Cucumis melo var. makuwa TaxID=1194695 RepID=A0A5D3C538_CUCMM|nr:reverse transcriptase [Cucumis melo var. makuwa]TYK05509.1 reverse transcriptase [Cucumis melo var. makuwa]